MLRTKGEQAMELIENEAIQTYQKNLEYFIKEHKGVTTALTALEMAINNGDYTPIYDLEYVNDNFDAKNLITGEFLYNKNSMSISKQLTDLVNLRKNHFLFEGFPLYNFSKKQLENLDDMSEGLKGLFPLMTYYTEVSKDTDEMKAIPKMMFIGVGLGMHIPMIDKKVNAEEYLIVEDNLELFKLSMFTTKYYELAEHATLYFSIADDENLFLTTMYNFLSNSFYDNRYIKYVHFPTHSVEKMKHIQNSLGSQSFSIFPYRHELVKSLRPLDYINNNYSVLNVSTSFQSALFNEKPVLVVTSGPSFKKNIEWLKKNQDKFIIITVSASLNTFYKNNIKPDIVVQIDGFDVTFPHYENIPAQEFLKDTIFLFGAFVQKRVRDLFDPKQIFNFEENTSYFSGFGTMVTPCVGSTALMLSIVFSTKNIYLLGLDLAFDQDTGARYSDDHSRMAYTDLDSKNLLSDTIDLEENVFLVKGNFKESVYTNTMLHSSVQSLHHNIPIVKSEHQNIYNLNNGAYINKSTPMHIEDVPVSKLEPIDKKELNSTLQEVFNAHSAKKLSASDVNRMKAKLQAGKIIQKHVQEYCNSVSHSNSNKYLYDLLGIVSTILKHNAEEFMIIRSVYFQFFKYILPIIMDLFNTKNLKNEKRHIKKVDKVMRDELNFICNYYVDKIENFIQTRC